MKKWIGAGVATLVVALAWGVVLQAQDRMFYALTHGAEGQRFQTGGFEGGPGFRGHDRMMDQRLLAMLDNDKVKTELGLTDDQATRLRQVVVDSEKATVKTRAEMEVRGIELRELLRADKPDSAVVMKKVDEISALRGEMMKQHIQALLSAKTILTPEQQKKIRSFLEHRRGEFGAGNRFFERRVLPPMGMGKQGARPAPPDAPEAPPNPE
jgi:periplasmic protein CpxP/Spy